MLQISICSTRFVFGNMMTEAMNEKNSQESENEAKNMIVTEDGKKDKRKTVFVLLLSFFVPTLLMGLIWGSKGITYGGTVTPLIYDMRQQYMPFLASLRYIAEGKNSIFFNWSSSLGGDFFGLFAYYLASPLNWLTVLWKLENIPDAIYVLTLLKIGLSGLTFSIFLQYGLSAGKAKLHNVLFACCYALMSYIIMYSMCIMWLEGLIFLPLILLGVEKIIEGKKGLLFLISLFGMFWCNFYLSYMVGIFAAIYFLCRIISTAKKGEFKASIRKGISFGVNTLLALGMAMPIVYPALKSLANCLEYRNLYSGVSSDAYQFSITELLVKFLPQQYDSIYNSGLPSIFCGSMISLLAIVFFLQKRGVREKICGCILLASSFVGFLVPKADYIWHGFQYPHGYPYRYAFVFSTAMIILAYRAVQRINLKNANISLAFTTCAMYTLLELFLNGSVIVGGLNIENIYMVRNDYNQKYSLCAPLIDKIHEETGFYRMNQSSRIFTLNDSMLFGINGFDYFGSMFNPNVVPFLKAMGYIDQIYVISGMGSTPLTSSILGTKYLLDFDETYSEYTLMGSNTVRMTTINLYENPNAFSMAFAIPDVILKENLFITKNVFENQNLLTYCLSGQEFQIFSQKQYTKEDTEKHIFSCTFENKENADLYAYYLYDNVGAARAQKSGYRENVTYTITNTADDIIKTTAPAYMMVNKLPAVQQSESLHLQVEANEGYSFEDMLLYSFNEEEYIEFVESMSSKQAIINTFDKNRIAGTFSLGEDELLLTTIPFDKGLRVKVDGEPAVYGSAMGTFLVILAPEGSHEFEITYVPVNFLTGLSMAGIAGLISLVIYIVIPKLCAKGRKR